MVPPQNLTINAYLPITLTELDQFFLEDDIIAAFVKTIVFACVSFMLTSSTYGQAPPSKKQSKQVSTLRMDLSTEDLTHKNAKSICKKLKKNLAPKTSPYGFGLISSLSCYLNKKWVGGKKKRKPFWRLDVNSEKSGIRLTLRRKVKKKYVVERKITLDSTEWLRLMGVDAGNRLFSAIVTDMFPFVGRVTLDSLGRKVHSHLMPTSDRAFLPSPPPKIGVISLVKPLAKAKALQIETVSEATFDEGEDVGSFEWVFSEEEQIELGNHWLALPRSRLPQYLESLERLLMMEKASLSDGRRLSQSRPHEGVLFGGYLGVRYGMALTNDKEDLLAKSRMYGILGQIRSGWFEGVSFYYDVHPRIESPAFGSTAHLEWSRALIGYGLSIDAQVHQLFDLSFNVNPRLGVWKLDARLPYTNPFDNTRSMRVSSLKNAFSLGVDFSSEFLTPIFVTRLFGSYDRTMSSVSSLRYGVDLLIDGPTIVKPNTNVSFSLFFMSEEMVLLESEDVVLETDAPFDPRGTEEVDIEIKFNFTGLGIGVSW